MALGIFEDIDFMVLTSLITIGDADPINPMIINNPVYMTEVGNISIDDSYKTLINTATVSFPKGSVFNKDIIRGFTDDGTISGEVIQKTMSSDNIYTSRSKNVIVEKTVSQNAVSKDAFKVGQRISIKIGYNGKLKRMFEGYISGIIPESEITLKCENMARILKTKQAPKITVPTATATVSNICGEKYNLLKGTGLELHSETKKYNINVGELVISDNFTIFDVFQAWSRSQVYVFLKFEDNDNSSMPKLAIAQPYSSANRNEGVKPIDSAILIDFQYHVTNNGLSFEISDPMFLAVQGTGVMKNGKFFSLTVRKNPEYNPSNPNSKKYQTVNATQFSKAQQKKTGNATAIGAENKTKVDLSTYTIIPYVSKKYGISSEELRDECITWFETYQDNGVEGSITILGDYGLSSASMINVVDNINSDKNGIYIVEEVKTEFGINGYKQTLKIPYRVKRTEK